MRCAGTRVLYSRNGQIFLQHVKARRRHQTRRAASSHARASAEAGGGVDVNARAATAGKFFHVRRVPHLCTGRV